ncbi:hypothetical protein CKO51_31375 [Rhodopirellula sp. SM50]|nr:hypothetical protein CKO51_31375 [Rhodopirellula sp. SM50]
MRRCSPTDADIRFSFVHSAASPDATLRNRFAAFLARFRTNQEETCSESAALSYSRGRPEVQLEASSPAIGWRSRSLRRQFDGPGGVSIPINL